MEQEFDQRDDDARETLSEIRRALHRAGADKDCDECLETGGHEVGPL